MSSGFPLTIIKMPLVDKLERYFSAAPTAQTEEFMLQNVAYRATVYRTGPQTSAQIQLNLFFTLQLAVR